MKTTLALALMGAALISAPAIAQNSSGQSQNTTQQEAKAAPLYQMKAGQWRATKIDGLNVYNPNNEKIGDISEMILDHTGKIQAVVIGVGGFLGIGEHLVAVPFEQVQWVDQPVERRTSGNDRTNSGSGAGAGGTAGSGTSTGSGATGMNSNAERQGGTTATNAPAGGSSATNAAGDNTGSTEAARTQTTTDPRTGATVTTTTGDNTVATGSNRPATTGADQTANRAGNQNDTSQTYRPDHAVVAMTKDQLKALPEVRYSR
jgi:sporulation protein YlmC with PRC-barrel domain